MLHIQSQPVNRAKLRDDPGWRLAGFGGSYRPVIVTNGTVTCYVAAAPDWAIIFCGGTFAIAMYQLAKRRRRAEAVKRGNCPSCGYDLWANASAYVRNAVRLSHAHRLLHECGAKARCATRKVIVTAAREHYVQIGGGAWLRDFT